MLHKHHRNTGGFTLVEIMIVVAIIALLAAIAVPNFMRARKRAQATRYLQDLRLIDSAIDLYAIERNKAGGAPVAWSDVQLYLKSGSVLHSSAGKDMFGTAFSSGNWAVDTLPKIPTTSFNKLSDVAPSDFWSPYGP